MNSDDDSIDDRSYIDWTDCALVEVIPGKVSGVPLVKGTRMPADGVVENYDSGSLVEEIAYNFDLSLETVRALVAFADARQPLIEERQSQY